MYMAKTIGMKYSIRMPNPFEVLVTKTIRRFKVYRWMAPMIGRYYI